VKEMNGDATWWIFWIIVVIIIIWLILAQRRSRIRRTDRLNPYEKTSLEILNKKYAKNEISREEYERKKKDLD
jgi:putative membrane protein